MTWIEWVFAAWAVYVAGFVALVAINRRRQRNRLRVKYNRIIAGLDAMADCSYFPVPADPGSVLFPDKPDLEADRADAEIEAASLVGGAATVTCGVSAATSGTGGAATDLFSFQFQSEVTPDAKEEP